VGYYVVVLNTSNGLRAFAVVGDTASSGNCIYVSIALANLLRIQFDLKKRTVGGDKISCVVFPDSGNGYCPESPAVIDEQGRKWFAMSNLQSYIQSRKQK
jgi:hypothetical protein